MNWYKNTIKYAFPGSYLPKSDKWEEVEDSKEVIQDMVNDGHPLREIALLFNVGIPLFTKMMATFGIKRNKEITKQKAKEMLDNGEPLTNVSKKLKVDPKTIKKWFGIETRKIKRTPNVPVTPEEGKEIIRLHEEGLRPTEIIKQVNRSLSTVKTYLERAGVYQRLRGDWIRFNPSPEQIQKIDYWYALPPKGEGRSLYWIATQFNILSSQLGEWFKKTGRPIRPQAEQAKTEFSRGEQSANKLLEWEEKGYLEGYLKSLSYDRALWYLNKYVGRIYDNNPQKASAIRVKYTRIIEDHFAQQPQPIQSTISHSLNWYRTAQSNIHGYPLEFKEEVGNDYDELLSEEPFEWSNEKWKTGPKKDYFKEMKGRTGEIRWMSPDEYIDICAMGFYGKTEYFKNESFQEYKKEMIQMRRRSTKGEEGPNLIETYQDRWVNGEQPYMGYITYQNGEFRGQEGLHRAIMALDLGIESIPILIVNTETSEDYQF